MPRLWESILRKKVSKLPKSVRKILHFTYLPMNTLFFALTILILFLRQCFCRVEFIIFLSKLVHNYESPHGTVLVVFPHTALRKRIHLLGMVYKSLWYILGSGNGFDWTYRMYCSQSMLFFWPLLFTHLKHIDLTRL